MDLINFDDIDVTANNPLEFGIIWHRKYGLNEEKIKDSELNKYWFKKVNKSKKEKRFQCKFHRNVCELWISEKGLSINAYGTDEDYHYFSILFEMPFYTYDELKWILETTNKLENDDMKINKYENYKLAKVYSNNAYEFIKDDSNKYGNNIKLVTIWKQSNGEETSIDLIKTHNLELLKSRIASPSILGCEQYFPIVYRPFQMTKGLLETIIKEIESMMEV